MAHRNQSRFWRLCRIYLRRFRITVLLVTLALVGALVYLDQVGLPGFIKRPLLQKLRDRGLHLQFSRLRWRWHLGLVAENVSFGATNAAPGPKLWAREVRIRLNYAALATLRFQVSGVVLEQGLLTWPVDGTNGTRRELSVREIQTELRLLPGDVWELDNFQAHFAGADLHLSGVVTNASAVRDWKLFQGRQAAPPGALQNQLRQFADTLQEIHFTSPPELEVDVRGDALVPQSFSIRFALNAAGAATPWGNVQGGTLTLLLHPTGSNSLSRVELNLQAAGAQTRWATATNLTLTLRAFPGGSAADSVRADLELGATDVATRWGRSAGVYFNAHWLHSITNPVPISGRGELQADGIRTGLGMARSLHVAGDLLAATNTVAVSDSWAWWAGLAPYALAWDAEVRGLDSVPLATQEVFCSGNWDAPRLTVSRVAATLYGGRLNAAADLDVTDRSLRFTSALDFDVRRISGMLTEKSREWLSQFSWSTPPAVRGDGAVVLPAWTNLARADWRGDVRPTLRLDGTFRIGDGAFRGVSFTSAESHFSYSNLCWRLPDLSAVRPEGRIELVHESDERTQDYYFRVHSTIDVRALRPLLDPPVQRGLDLVGFTQPPLIDGEVWGRWRDYDRIGGKARVALTNFTLRGESASDFQSAVEYTNRFLVLIEPRAHRGTQELAASGVGVDFPGRKVYLTNGFSTAEPHPVARAIGPVVFRAVEPYQFRQPPTVRAHGVIPIDDEVPADLHFDIDGGAFTWWRFHVPHIVGKVDWTGDHLALNDVRVDFYQGIAVGRAGFDFIRGHGANFHFDLLATDANFHQLTSDLAQSTNRVEGLLTAHLDVTRANTDDPQSWQGAGRVNLRDGLIWEIPVFGIFSPVLDGIAPGLGSSRAKEASATFTIANSVIRSDDVEIRASKMRLKYWGTVDFNGRLDARSDAELFRDTVVVGRLLSMALWPVSKVFEYKITGTLHEPKVEPVFFLPKMMLMPFRTLRELAEPPHPDFSQTNAPVLFAPQK